MEYKYEFEINKSRFISYLFQINNKEEIDKIIENLWKDNKKARHICYAYKFKDQENIIKTKVCDDGEPKGTAGLPIYSVIDKNNLENILIVVIRYFGGKKLGSGPLFRAYLKSANEVYKIYNN